MSSFRRGFRNSNPLVLVVAALLLVPALLGIEGIFASGLWTRAPLEYCLRTARDSFTYVSWTVGRTKQAPPEGPAVYLLGGSAAREAIDGEDLAVDIAELGGPDVTAYDFGSINQNFAQSLTVLDNVPDTPAWLIVGVNLGRFTSDKEASIDQVRGREFLLKSPALQSFVSDEWGVRSRGRTILPGVFSYVTDLSERQVQRLLAGAPLSREYRQHTYTAGKVRSVPEKEQMVEVWNTERYPVFERNRLLNLQVLEALVERGRERGLHVVLVELPLNEAIVRGRFDYARADYKRPVRDLARRYDLPYLDFNDELAIRNADFYDLSHLVEPGRELWQRRLARELVGLMGAADADS